ncbi:hypothetical protein [Kitasatospora terrestris]|uniref:hypothetical protein n=1 Tax=Kitasatospora terrestris TaxID=258051 RepID=UPI0031F07E2C
MRRLACDDDTTAIVCIWDEGENYWPSTHADHADPFSHASGIDLFQAATRTLDVLGIRTPRIRLADPSRSRYPAVVEDVPGENLGALRRDPHHAEPTVALLAVALDVVQRHTGPCFGKAALRDTRIGRVREHLEQVVHELAATVHARSEYGPVHMGARIPTDPIRRALPVAGRQRPR